MGFHITEGKKKLGMAVKPASLALGRFRPEDYPGRKITGLRLA